MHTEHRYKRYKRKLNTHHFTAFNGRNQVALHEVVLFSTGRVMDIYLLYPFVNG